MEKNEEKKTMLLGFEDTQVSVILHLCFILHHYTIKSKCFCAIFIIFQCKLELHDVGGPVDHATAFGRIAFSCPREQVKQYWIKLVVFLLYNPSFIFLVFCYFSQLPELEALIKKENQKILTPLVSLDTPGKATVEVVILADPVSG